MDFLKKKKIETDPFFARLPKDIRARMALIDGVIHISEELKGKPYMIEFVQEQKKRGILEHKFHKANVFDEKYTRETIAFSVGTNQSELQKLVKSILQKAHEQKASDIHIKDLGTHCLVRFRIIGMLSDYTTYTAEQGRALMNVIYSTMCQSCSHNIFSLRENMDARIVDKHFLPKGVYSVRVHVEPTESIESPEGIGSCMFLRLLYDATKAEGNLDSRLETLGFLPEQRKSFEFLTTRTGLVIISGPTGHGKSTVLKHCHEAMVFENPQKAFMSVEDPPEYVIEGIDQIIVSTKEENRGKSYINAIAGAMRSDVDNLLIGEMRYAESIMAGLNAAMTGHAVWATIHASDALSIVLRMVTLLTEKGYANALDHICEPNVLAGLEYQRLIPILCPECRKKYINHHVNYPYESLKSRINTVFNDLDNICILGDGCDSCNHRGVIGQKVVAEVITTDVTLLSHIRKNDFQSAKNYFVHEKKGITHVQHALKLIEQGLADPFMTESRLGLPLDVERGLV